MCTLYMHAFGEVGVVLLGAYCVFLQFMWLWLNYTDCTARLHTAWAYWRSVGGRLIALGAWCV